MTGNVQLYLPDGNRKAVPTPDGRAHSETGAQGQVPSIARRIINRRIARAVYRLLRQLPHVFGHGKVEVLIDVWPHMIVPHGLARHPVGHDDLRRVERPALVNKQMRKALGA